LSIKGSSEDIGAHLHDRDFDQILFQESRVVIDVNFDETMRIFLLQGIQIGSRLLT
jgi:hypothetical protein